MKINFKLVLGIIIPILIIIALVIFSAILGNKNDVTFIKEVDFKHDILQKGIDEAKFVNIGQISFKKQFEHGEMNDMHIPQYIGCMVDSDKIIETADPGNIIPTDKTNIYPYYEYDLLMYVSQGAFSKDISDNDMANRNFDRILQYEELQIFEVKNPNVNYDCYTESNIKKVATIIIKK